MFGIDHTNLPADAEHWELRQFVNSMTLRAEAERQGCSSITVVSYDYRDRLSGQKRQGYFVAPKDNPMDPLFLIAEKKGGKGAGLFRYETMTSHSSQGGWELVH